MGVGTQASLYGVTARHRRRRPTLPILTPPANPGLRVTTATELQPRVPFAHAVHGPVWSLQTRVQEWRRPLCRFEGQGEPRDLQRPPTPSQHQPAWMSSEGCLASISL